MHIEIRWCSSCASEAMFEQPPCEDGHGVDCLDLACVDCGYALVLVDVTAAAPAHEAARAA